MLASPTPRALPTKGAVHYTGIPRSTLYELAGRGLLDVRKSGRRAVWLVDSLNKYLDGLPAANLHAQAVR